MGVGVLPRALANATWFGRSVGVALLALTASTAVGQSSTSSSKSSSPSQDLTEHVTVDWSAGVMVAKAVGLADRRAPAPDVARAAARSRGVTQARAHLRAALLLVPWANGKTSTEQLSAAELETLVAAATLGRAQPQTDGGWHIELQLPVEVVRQAVQGNRKRAVDGDDMVPPAIALDARKLSVLPAVGMRVNDGGATVECAMRWVTRWPGASIKVSHVTAGQLAVSKPVGIKPATLCVIIVSQ